VPYETSRTEYVNTTVHEHRAPTDASVALLKEMEQAARNKIEASINVGGNGFECVVNIMKEAMSMDTVAVAIFKLNGKSMRAEARVQGWDHVNPADLAGKLRDAVAQQVAVEVLTPSLFAAIRDVWF
jgi:hypothetical protein